MSVWTKKSSENAFTEVSECSRKNCSVTGCFSNFVVYVTRYSLDMSFSYIMNFVFDAKLKVFLHLIKEIKKNLCDLTVLMKSY